MGNLYHQPRLVDFHIQGGHMIYRCLTTFPGNIVKDSTTPLENKAWQQHLQKLLKLKPDDVILFDIVDATGSCNEGIPMVAVILANYVVIKAFFEHDGPDKAFEVRGRV